MRYILIHKTMSKLTLLFLHHSGQFCVALETKDLISKVVSPGIAHVPGADPIFPVVLRDRLRLAPPSAGDRSSDSWL